MRTIGSCSISVQKMHYRAGEEEEGGGRRRERGKGRGGGGGKGGGGGRGKGRRLRATDPDFLPRRGIFREAT